MDGQVSRIYYRYDFGVVVAVYCVSVDDYDTPRYYLMETRGTGSHHDPICKPVILDVREDWQAQMAANAHVESFGSEPDALDDAEAPAF